MLGRRTILARGGGIYSFMAKIGVDIAQLYNRLSLLAPLND
jgi:hypothetical protein